MISRHSKTKVSKFRYATDFSKHKKHPVFEYFINKEYDKFIQSINITKHYDKEASIQILKQLDETQKQPVMFWVKLHCAQPQ